MIGLLLLICLIWLVVSIVRKDFTNPSFWFTAFLIIAVLIFLGYSFPEKVLHW
jgi:hypothetical protein